jgi:hypothetical protein
VLELWGAGPLLGQLPLWNGGRKWRPALETRQKTSETYTGTCTKVRMATVRKRAGARGTGRLPADTLRPPPPPPAPTLHAADSIWGSPTHPEGSFPDTNSGVAPTQNLSIHHQYHKRVHLWAGHPAHIWCICGPRVPNAVSYRWRGASAFQVGSGQWSGDTCTMRGMVMVQLESPFEVENGLVELSPEAHSPKGHYAARTPVWDCLEVPVKVLNATSLYFKQLIWEWVKACACMVVSYDSLPCKPSHDWSCSACSCLYRVSYGCVLQLIIPPPVKFTLLTAFFMVKTRVLWNSLVNYVQV